MEEEEYIFLHKEELEKKKHEKIIAKMGKYGHHLQYSIWSLIEHLAEEIIELCEAYKQEDKEKMKEECIDVSNLVDMIYDSIA